MDRIPGAPSGPYGFAAVPQTIWPTGLYCLGGATQPPQPGPPLAPEVPLGFAAPTPSAESAMPRVEMPGLSEHAYITHDAHNTRDAHDAHGRQDGVGRQCTTNVHKQTMHHSHIQEREIRTAWSPVMKTSSVVNGFPDCQQNGPEKEGPWIRGRHLRCPESPNLLRQFGDRAAP